MGAAAVVTSLKGGAYALRNGEKHPLSVGSELLASDEVHTEADGKIEMRFQDNAVIDLGPSSAVGLREFVFDPQGQEKPSFILDMMGGVVRSVSGKVVEQNPDSFKLVSPLGAVGIRGTTTMHKISPESEVHMVTNMDRGHSVTLTTPDGRHVVISNAMQGVNLAPGGNAPLTIMQISPAMIENMIEQGMINGKAVGAASSTTFFIAMDAAALAAESGGGDASGGEGGGGGGTVALINSLTGATENVELSAEDLQSVADAVQAISTAMVTGVLELAGVNEQNEREAHELADNSGGNTPDIPNIPDIDPVNPPLPPFDPMRPDMPPWNVADYASNTYDTPARGSITIDSKGAVLGGAGGELNLDAPFLIIAGAGGNSITLNADLAEGIIIGDQLEALGKEGAGDACVGDNIRIAGSIKSGMIYGDAKTIAHMDGGDDNISVGGDMIGGFIVGDAHTFTHGIAGTDYINISGNMDAKAVVYGDAHNLAEATGGNDIISINGELKDGVIQGDAYAMNNATGGNDRINLGVMDEKDAGGEVVSGSGGMSGGIVYGDAAIITESAAGNDKFNIHEMSGGVIYGDGEALSKATAGADIFSINIMSGGTIYGDAKIASHSSVGNDVFNIGQMSGGTIYGSLDPFQQNGDIEANTQHGDQNRFSIGEMSGGTIFTGNDGDIINIDKIVYNANGEMNIVLGEGQDYITVNDISSAGGMKLNIYGLSSEDGDNFAVANMMGLSASTSEDGSTVTYKDDSGNTLLTVNLFDNAADYIASHAAVV